MAHDVFISYSHHDKAVADAACVRLEQAGHRCWIAPRDVGGGEWGKAIIEGIRGARAFVLIFSTQANRSPQVNREVERAVSHGLPIVPLRIEDITPSDALEFFICNQHWLDALTPPLERHLDKLADMLGGLLGTPAPAWAATSAPAAKTRSGRSAAKVVASLSVLALTAAAGLWLFPAWNPPTDPAVPVPAPAPKPGPAPPAATPAAAAPAPQDETLLDFPSIAGNDDAPYGWLDAQPSLRTAAVRVRIVEISGPGADLGSGLLSFTTSSILRMEDLIVPGPNRTLLVYKRPLDPGATYRASLQPSTPFPPAVPSFVVLEFEEPVAQVSFSMPAVQPGSSFAGVTIRGYTASGEEIQNRTRNPVTSGNRAPAQSLTLTGWARQGILRVRLEPNYVPDGRWGHGVGFLIEGITIRRMAGPAA